MTNNASNKKDPNEPQYVSNTLSAHPDNADVQTTDLDMIADQVFENIAHEKQEERHPDLSVASARDEGKLKKDKTQTGNLFSTSESHKEDSVVGKMNDQRIDEGTE